MADTIEIQAGSFAHQVYGNLWIGNAPPITSVHERGFGLEPLSGSFDTLVLCAREYQLHGSLFAVEEVIHAPMDDELCPVKLGTSTMAISAARKVAKKLAMGEHVLVTCLAGRNRSGLVCALALCLGESDFSAAESIRLVRNARGVNSLANPFFVKFLKSAVK